MFVNVSGQNPCRLNLQPQESPEGYVFADTDKIPRDFTNYYNEGYYKLMYIHMNNIIDYYLNW